MTYETAIGMLRVARTGDEMLRVLDTLDRTLTRADHVLNEGLRRTVGVMNNIVTITPEQNVPTLEPMEF